MPITIPENSKEIFDKIAQDIKALINDLDPYLQASLINALVSSISTADFEIYKTLQQAENANIWDTTSGEELIRWAAIFGFIKLAATKSSGFVTFTGIATTSIPINTQFTSANGNFYQTTSASTITAQSISITSLTRSGTTATAITATPHGLGTGMSITISGAVETDYNGIFTIIATGLSTFTYQVDNSPTTPATGTILLTGDYVNVDAESIDFGADQNLINGTTISLSTPIAGVDTDGVVSFDELAGGTDEETDNSLRERWLDRVRNPISPFNEQNIIGQAKTVAGVTRVWVQSPESLIQNISVTSITRDGQFATITTATDHSLATGQRVTISGADQTEYNVTGETILVLNATQFVYPVTGTPTTPATGTITGTIPIVSIGSVRIFFVRDNDTSIFPSASEIQDVKDAILEITPINVLEESVIVDSPTGLSVPFTFSSISPDTTAMRQAITDNLTLYFDQGVTVAEDITEIDYESVINASVDSGGNVLESFNLSTPTADITVDANELPVLGTITF